jgi:hypothetical protein
MNPSLSSINQNLLMTSDYFIVPTSPDYFALMAIRSMSTIIPRWKKWADQARKLQQFEKASYPFPKNDTRFLGTIIQRFRPRSGAPARAFQDWIDQINSSVAENLVPTFEANDMMLPSEKYQTAHIDSGKCLETISDFNSLIARSQEHRKPIFSLSNEEIGQTGKILERSILSKDEFEAQFVKLANKVIALTS